MLNALYRCNYSVKARIIRQVGNGAGSLATLFTLQVVHLFKYNLHPATQPYVPVANWQMAKGPKLFYVSVNIGGVRGN